MTKIGFYLYDNTNGQFKYDFSKYVQMPINETPTLDDTLNTYKITLKGLPFEKEFEPETRFVMTYEYDLDGTTVTSLLDNERHFVVENDSVSKEIMSEDYYTHELSLCDPAVIAQKRAVDNVSLTYKLKDVNLSSDSVDLINNANVDVITREEWLPNDGHNFGTTRTDFWTTYYAYGTFFKWKYPTITYDSSLTDSIARVTYSADNDLSALANIFKQNFVYGNGTIDVSGVEVTKVTEVTFNIPMLYASFGQSDTRDIVDYGFVDTQLVITDTNNNVNTTTETTIIARPSNKFKYGDRLENDVLNEQRLLQSFRAVDDELGYIDLGKVAIGSEIKEESTGIQAWLTRKTYNGDSEENGIIPNRTITLTLEPNHIYTLRFSYVNNYRANRIVYEEVKALQLTTPVYKASYYKVTFGSSSGDMIYYEEDSVRSTLKFNVFNEEDYYKYVTRSSDLHNAYYLFQKAQLTTQNFQKVSGTPYYETEMPFVLENPTELQNVSVNEDMYNSKNLWEVIQRIAEYIHSKPYVRFNRDSNNFKDQYIVKFLKYGGTNSIDKNTQQNIYNSKMVSEYVSELSSYIDNYLQLGGNITEFLSVKSTSEDYLVYNDVALLKTKYPILEVLYLGIINSSGSEVDITDHIYEYNIYKLLPIGSENAQTKGQAIYYMLGNQTIRGFQYVTPSETGVKFAYSMKNIISSAFGVKAAEAIINQYSFKIIYRTKDSTRISTMRPDIRKYLHASKLDNYPMHVQFNQQQDKMVSSQAYGLNAYGKLMRTGNSVYNVVEWLDNPSKMQSVGNLYEIDNNVYYISKINRLWYKDHLVENLELTKDFNRLAQIIGIPSEPRFYEVSEQSQIDRNVVINDFLTITTTPDDYANPSKIAYNLINYIIPKYSAYRTQNKYAMTCFKSDIDRKYDNQGGDADLLTEWHKIVLEPCLQYFQKNTMCITWEMEDNFSAGDRVESTDTQVTQLGLNVDSILRYLINGSSTTTKDVGYYKTLVATQYCDIFGRADLFDFILFYDLPISQSSDNIYDLPNVDLRYTDFDKALGLSLEDTFDVSTTNLQGLTSNSKGLILAKDNREKISFSYNLNLLTDSDRFVIGDNVFSDTRNFEGGLYIWYLNQELSKLSTNTVDLENITLRQAGIGVNFLKISEYGLCLELSQIVYAELDILSNCKCIAITSRNKEGLYYEVLLARNVSGLTIDEIAKNWYFRGKQNSFKTNVSQLDDVKDLISDLEIKE